MSWFIIALLYEILAEAVLWVYVPLAETGFLGITLAMIANQAIKTEEASAASERYLEAQVNLPTCPDQTSIKPPLSMRRMRSYTATSPN
jgi:hypothetical protein